MSPEQELMDDLLRQGKASLVGIDEAMGIIGLFPKSVDEFGNMNVTARVGSTALIKDFERLEDIIASLFRTILKALGQSLKGLYAFDIGEHMVVLSSVHAALPTLRDALIRAEIFICVEKKWLNHE